MPASKSLSTDQRSRTKVFDTEALDSDLDGDLAHNDDDIIAWRLDPEESWSDWKIEIRRKDSQSIDTYHVHRTHLTSGAETSNYFVALFRSSNNFRESDSTSRIELEDEAAEAFPLFLDFIYSGKLPSQEKMISLHYLGSYFGNKSLEKMGRAAVEKHLTVENLQYCLPLILKFPHDSLLNIARFRLLQLYLQGGSREGWDLPLFTQVDTSFFEALIEDWNLVIFSRAQWARTFDPFISRIIAQYIDANPQCITKDIFIRLTDKRRMPVVDARCASKLLELESTILGNDLRSSTSLSCLQYRCLHALLDYQRNHGNGNEPRLFDLGKIKLFQRLSSALSPKRKQDESLLQLSMIRHRIRVTGSQIDGVDGVYNEETMKDGTRRYVKWDCNDKYDIVRFEDSWCLGKHHDGVLIHVFKFVFDERDTRQDCSQLPPAFGWQPVQDIVCSSPILIFEEADVDADDPCAS